MDWRNLPTQPRPRVVSVDVAPATPARPRFAFGSRAGDAAARFFAFVVDLVVVTLVVTELAYSLIAFNPFTGLPTNSERGFYATLALGVAVALVYIWIAEALFGTTLGKLAFGLHVYALRGGRIGLGPALVRSLLRAIDVLAIGGILALLPARRRLGDLLAGTVVARSPLASRAATIGFVALLVLLGLPFVVVGVGRTFAAMFALVEFLPRLVAHGWSVLHRMTGG
jgi:uncharacterized RDD family membrane protein YckC